MTNMYHHIVYAHVSPEVNQFHSNAISQGERFLNLLARFGKVSPTHTLFCLFTLSVLLTLTL